MIDNTMEHFVIMLACVALGSSARGVWEHFKKTK